MGRRPDYIVLVRDTMPNVYRHLMGPSEPIAKAHRPEFGIID